MVSVLIESGNKIEGSGRCAAGTRSMGVARRYFRLRESFSAMRSWLSSLALSTSSCSMRRSLVSLSGLRPGGLGAFAFALELRPPGRKLGAVQPVAPQQRAQVSSVSHSPVVNRAACRRCSVRMRVAAPARQGVRVFAADPVPGVPSTGRRGSYES